MSVGEDIDFGIIEGSGTEVAADGTIVMEHVAAIVDPETGEAVIDNVVAVVAPDGSEVVAETLTVVDAEGNIRVIGAAGAPDDEA